MDDSRLAAAQAAAAETERAIKFYLDAAPESPLEQHSGLTAYRNAVGLRKALDSWMELRAARARQPVSA